MAHFSGKYGDVQTCETGGVVARVIGVRNWEYRPSSTPPDATTFFPDDPDSWREFVEGINEYEIGFDVVFDDDQDFTDDTDIGLNTGATIDFELYSDAGPAILIEGSAIITGGPEVTTPYDDVVAYRVTAKGTGVPTVTVTEDGYAAPVP